MEHVNLTVPDQSTATAFYLSTLGGTRDPYLMVGVENMWVNLGNQQFHLPTNEAQHLRGHVGLVTPSLDQLKERLSEAEETAVGDGVRVGGQALLRRGDGPVGEHVPLLRWPVRQVWRDVAGDSLC